MQTRKIGNRGFEISALGQGCMSANPLVNMELVGEALAPVRKQVVIATKFGFDLDPQAGERRGSLNSRPEPAASKITPAGARLPEGALAMTGR